MFLLALQRDEHVAGDLAPLAVVLKLEFMKSLDLVVLFWRGGGGGLQGLLRKFVGGQEVQFVY